ncbi:diacylglycerol kinase theta-like [Branchiostoma lanceolatum]|uniref:diacylglycerol kinase theta-like n=1 Tax=Branchiostoma lanceolatum TaxID=7740 RepID=UPI0011331A2C
MKVIRGPAMAVFAPGGGAVTPREPEHGSRHLFHKKTFHKPTYCHHCTELLWGVLGQGYVCEMCNFVSHDKCRQVIVTPCTSLAPQLVKHPVAHCWSNAGRHFKKKFCNVCRKKLDDLWVLRCEVCEYYVHADCQDFAVSDCRQCAAYQPQRHDLMLAVHTHLWREGNLGATAKCVVCKKNCGTTECLASMRCEWCGVKAHTGCYRSIPAECSFGALQKLMLPPVCVHVPSAAVAAETLMGQFGRKRQVKVDRDDEDSADARTPGTQDEQGKSKMTVKVYDGSASLKRNCFRTVTVSRGASPAEVLEAAMKSHHIVDNPIHYYLSQVDRESPETEKPLNNNDNTFQLSASEGKAPAVCLRFSNKGHGEKGMIRVYPGMLRVAVAYKTIPVTNTTTVDEAIQMALEKFGLREEDPSYYSLVEVLIDKGVQERVMQRDEYPWPQLVDARQGSLRQMKLTRFYLRNSSHPEGPVELFVYNLPAGLAPGKYVSIMAELLGKNTFTTVGPIHPQYGASFMTFSSADTALRALSMLNESIVDEKQITAMLLPHVEANMIPNTVTPLLVFVNTKSGGCQGVEILSAFRHLLNPHQVFDLDQGGPLPGLLTFRNVRKYRILICGGDGSVGWVLSCLDGISKDLTCSTPPTAILPIGTGNDLARVLGWGAGYTGNDDPLSLLIQARDADNSKFDRWTILFEPNEVEEKSTDSAMSTTGAASGPRDEPNVCIMNNYFGVGIDADLCLGFHLAREENPEKFTSRFHNKGVYVKLSLRKMMGRKSCKDLQRQIELEVDGQVVDLPTCEGIVFLNIRSWGSGCDPWGGEASDAFSPPSYNDGTLEVVGLTGVVHLGQIQGGIRGAIRVAQGQSIKLTLKNDIPVQIDGEPWLQPAGQVIIMPSAIQANMLRRRKTKVQRRNTEPSLFRPTGELNKALGQHIDSTASWLVSSDVSPAADTSSEAQS